MHMSYRSVFYFAVVGSIVSLATPGLADDTGMAGALHDLRKARGKICMSDHFHYGTSSQKRKKRSARIEAIQDWRGFVALEYGSDWANFRRAASKSIACTKAGGMWTCKVEARPCRRR
jgi:hypothetical protein